MHYNIQYTYIKTLSRVLPKQYVGVGREKRVLDEGVGEEMNILYPDIHSL